MKKRCFAMLLALVMTAALGAQEGAGLLSAGDLERYTKPFLNAGGRLAPKYTRVASDSDYDKFRDLGGALDSVDTPLEIALLSTCAGVVDVRPVEASNMLGNARQADLKLGAAVYQEMQVLRFLGNTDAAGRHEGIIKFITDRGNVSRAEIVDYLKQGIVQVVNAEFNKVVFGLGDYSTDKYYNATLIRSPQNGQYTLSYEGYFSGTQQTKQITAPSLNALLTEMRSGANKADFDQNCINQVNAQNANIPAVFLERIGKDPRAELAAILTAFYLNPTNQTAYGAVRDVNVYYDVAGGISDNPTNRAMYEMIRAAYINTLTALSPELEQRVLNDSRGRTSITLSVDVRNRLQLTQ
jgi:hypothetical protein